MSDDMSLSSPSSAGDHGVLRSMQEVAMSSQEASKMLRTYNIAWWGNNYYDVNELGHISVCPDPDVPEARVDLAELVKAREAQGQRLPALFCFPQILQHRLRSINAAFKRARESYGYNGDYFLVYPIKVNQHRRVIESLIHSGEPLGLEAGSKAELMAVLVHLDRVNQEVIAFIAVRFTRAFKRGVNGTQTMLQDLREAEQCRQALTLRFTGFHQFSEIHARFRDVRIRADTDVAQLVNVVVVIAPPGNIVSAQHLAGFLGAHRNLLHGT